MSKIIKAVNAMLSNQHWIGSVIRGCVGTELFFKYRGIYKWSIIKGSKDDYYLHYYPGKQELEDLAAWPEDAWHEFSDMISYNTKDLGTKEAYDTLSELYTVVQEKLYGMDRVLDEIIDDLL